MAITYPLTFPTDPAPANFDLTFMPNVGMSQSIYTDDVQTYTHDRLVWSAAVSMPTMWDAIKGREFHGFFTALRGKAGTFTMVLPDHASPRGTQNANFNVKTTTAIRSETLECDGLTIGATLLTGDMISVDDRLYMVMENATADGSGEATLTLSHGLRAEATAGDTVTCINPVGTWRLASDPVRQTNNVNHANFNFAIVEAV